MGYWIEPYCPIVPDRRSRMRLSMKQRSSAVPRYAHALLPWHHDVAAQRSPDPAGWDEIDSARNSHRAGCSLASCLRRELLPALT